jgi:hypothetical protein
MAYVDYAKRTRETRQDYQYTLAHEVAHQWWYGLVGNHSVYEPWLDEAEVAGRDIDSLFASWIDSDTGPAEHGRNAATPQLSPKTHPVFPKPGFYPRKGGPVE